MQTFIHNCLMALHSLFANKQSRKKGKNFIGKQTNQLTKHKCFFKEKGNFHIYGILRMVSENVGFYGILSIIWEIWDLGKLIIPNFARGNSSLCRNQDHDSATTPLQPRSENLHQRRPSATEPPHATASTT